MSTSLQSIYQKEQLLKCFFTTQIIPTSTRSIQSFYCGECKFNNFMYLDNTDNTKDIEWIESLTSNKQSNLSFISKIYPMMLECFETLSFDNNIDQVLYKRPFEDYAKIKDPNSKDEYKDDIIFHCFDETKQDKILKRYYFHCLLYWESHQNNSKIKQNTFLIRRALVIGTKIPCFNFCYNILKKLYEIFIKGNMHDNLDIILKKLFEDIQLKPMHNNKINIILDGIKTPNDDNDNNNNKQKQQKTISNISEYILPLDNQVSLFDLNLYYFFHIFSMEDILQIYSLFRFRLNMIFISYDINILYPIFYIVQNLFAPISFSHDFFIFKNLSTMDPDKFKFYFTSQSNSMLFVMGMRDDNCYKYFQKFLHNKKELKNITVFYIKQNEKGDFFLEKKSICNISKLSNQSITFVENYKTIPFFQMLFGTKYKFTQELEQHITKFILKSKGCSHKSFYGYDYTYNNDFYTFSKGMFKCNLRIIEKIFGSFYYKNDAHFLIPELKIKSSENNEELNSLLISIYLTYQYLIPSFDFFLDVFLFYFSKLCEKKKQTVDHLIFQPLPDHTLECSLNDIINNNIQQNNEQSNLDTSITLSQMIIKPIKSSSKPHLDLVLQEICVFDYFIKIGLISFDTSSHTFSNSSLGLGLFCLIKSLCLLNGYNYYMFYNDLEFRNEEDFIKNEINQMYNALFFTKGFDLFEIPIPLIILLKLFYNKDTNAVEELQNIETYSHFFYLSLSSYIFLRPDVSEQISKEMVKNIVNESCGIIQFLLFDNNGHICCDMDNVVYNDKNFTFKCCICKETLMLKIITMNKQFNKRKEQIMINIQTPNEIFPRIWKAICNQRNIIYEGCNDIKQLFNYQEWKNDYKLIYFYAYFVHGNKFTKYKPLKKSKQCK